MKLIELLVLEFANGKLKGLNPVDWPEGVVASQSYGEVQFEGWEYLYKSPTGSEWMTTVSFDVDGRLKYVGEYDDSEEVSRAEYFAFVEENPNFVADLEAKRKTNVGRITELNKIAYDAVDEAIKLSEEAGLPYTCSIAYSVAHLDRNSDWDSSSC